MNSQIDNLKIKALIGSIKIRLDKVDEQLSDLNSIQEEVKEIKLSFDKAVKLVNSNTETSEKNEEKRPKGGKSL